MMDDADLAKQELAAEIARIEEELEKKRLEEEIRKMEQMIEAHKSASSIKYDMEADNEDGEDILIEEYDDEEEEEIVEEYEDFEEDEMSYEEEIVEDEDEEYEVEYVDEEEEYEGYQDLGGDESGMFILPGNALNSSVVQTPSQPTDTTAPGPSPSLDSIEAMLAKRLAGAGFARHPGPVDAMLEDVPKQKQQVPSRPKPPAESPAPAAPVTAAAGLGLFDAIKGAATARNERLDVDGGKLQMKEYQPEVEAPKRSMDTFDLTAMVSKAARDREERLEAGGEKKMTEIKSKSEYKNDFRDIALEAAMLGRLTRLNEYIVEAVAVEKTPEEEWRSKGLLAIQWRNQHMAVIQEAARAGAASKLPEKITTNFVAQDEEEDENEDEEEEWEYDESKTSNRRVSLRMKQLLAMSSEVGTGQQKIDELILKHKEEKLARADEMVVKPMIYYCQDIKSVKLPRRKTPKLDPVKELEKIKSKFRGTYVTERPLSNISNEVAERAWARRTRLDRPGSLPRVQEVCNCPYCLDPSPMQTQAYKERDKERKEAGYESPDSEDERKKAREQRRMERRKQRIQGGGGGGASAQENGAPDETAVPARARRAARAGSATMEGGTGTVSRSSTISSSDASASSKPRTTSMISAELASMMESAAPKARVGPPRVRTIGGRIGAAAKQFGDIKAAAVAPNSTTPAAEVKAEASATPAPKPPTGRKAAVSSAVKDEETGKPKGRKVMRRRRKVGDAGAVTIVSSADNKEAKSSASDEAAPESAAMTREERLAKKRAARREGATKTAAAEPRKVRAAAAQVTPTSAASASLAEKSDGEQSVIIVKPDGTRVIRRRVVKSAGSPSKVVTRKVVRTVGGKQQVTNTTGEAADKTTTSPTPSPATTTTTTTSVSTTAGAAKPTVTRNRSGGKVVTSSGPGGNTTTTTTTRVRPGSNATPNTRLNASTGSIPFTSPASPPPTQSSSVKATAPNSSSTVTVTREGPSGARVVTTTTTTTTTRKAAAPAKPTRTGFFGRKRH